MRTTGDGDRTPRYACATSEDAATVTAIDLTTRQAVATLPTGPNSQDLAHDWRDAYA